MAYFLRRLLVAGLCVFGPAIVAQEGWSFRDVGAPAPTPAGSIQWSGATSAVLRGGGYGIGGSDVDHVGTGGRDTSYHFTGIADSFAYVLRSAVLPDEELIVRLVNIDGQVGAQAGILVRGPAVRFTTTRGFESQLSLGLIYENGKGLTVLARPNVDTLGAPHAAYPGETFTRSVDPTATLPLWLRIQHTATGALLSSSPDGTNWTLRHWETLATTFENLGLGVSGNEDGISATGTFDNLRVGALTAPIPPPAAPGNFRIIAMTSARVDFAWDDDPVGVDDYELERSTGGGPFARVVDSNSRLLRRDYTVTGGTTYTYRVRYVRGALFSAWSPALTITTPFVAAPSNLVADTSVPNQVTLRWNDNSPNETRFFVEKRIRETTFGESVGADTTQFTDTSLADNVSYYFRVRSMNDNATSLPSNEVAVRFGLTPTGGPTITYNPESRAEWLGASSTFVTSAVAAPGATFTWLANGRLLAEPHESQLALFDLQPEQAGVYQAVVSDSGGATVGRLALLGLKTVAKITGGGDEVGSDIRHANGNIYDQILMTSPSLSVTSNPGQIVRVSFLDLTDDIVQVEFSGAGTLTINLDSPSGPIPAANYNQSGIAYMKGHAGITISGANKDSHVSVFSVGRATAVNQSLFREGVRYDGVADLAYIAIQSGGFPFGGVRAGNASFWATRGVTGIYAPGAFDINPVYICDIIATEEATPMLVVPHARDIRITGGDLHQVNGRPVTVAAATTIAFTDGATSHADRLPAQQNRAQFSDEAGLNVTDQMVIQQP